MLTMLGIPNCDKVRAARRFFDQHGVNYRFRDIRKEQLSLDEWQRLVAADRQGEVLNTRSPSFRKTGADPALLNREKIVEILRQLPTAMKRPVVLDGDEIRSVGFALTKFGQYIKEASE